MPRRSFVSRLVLLAAASALTSGGPAAAVPVVAFHDDFNGDTPDQMPSTTPPGDPDGDALVLYHTAGDITVRSAVGAMTDQPLEFSRTGGVGTLHMYANLDPDYLDCPSYTVSFRMMVQASVFYVYTTLRGSSGQVLGSLEYRTGGVLTYNTALNTLSVGYVPGVPQLFEITVDMTTSRTSLSIDGVAVPEAQDMSFVNASPDFRRVIPAFGGQYVETMVLDDLQVVGDGCLSPVEASTWGRTKAIYR